MVSLKPNPQSRFQLLENATALPGSCVTCGASKGPYIDFGFTAEFYGAVIFCIPCAQDLGRSAGLVDNDDVVFETMRAEYAEARAGLIEGQIKDLVNVIKHSVDIFERNVSHSISSVQNASESEDGTTESESSLGEEFRTSDSNSKSSSVKKPSGVSSDSSGSELESSD